MLDKGTLKEKKNKLEELVNTFERTGKDYDETNTRNEFIDKFFLLLDWDVNNEVGYIGEYKEVEREDSVKIKGRTKKPDYAFRIGGVTKFYVEAKQPSVDIEKDPAPALQVRRYAYSKQLAISILTDFQELAIYQGDIKVNEQDKSHVGRLYYCKCSEYEKEFETIYNWVSKEAILKGSFDKHNKEKRTSKGTSTIDEEFLKDIKIWRKNLAEEIARRNKGKELKEYHINNAVQKILDRLIFLRMAEDKDAEDYGTLEKIANSKGNIYDELNILFEQANKKYNSGLFEAEEYINKLEIENKVVKNIIAAMYMPKSPYAFSVISPEILGSIYEQFLGDTIRLTASGLVKVEHKPEVAKSGGVYYTPQYIVNYIIEKTVGKKLKGKNPKEISEITICDPACGSGSFLIGAYNYLLNYHLKYYTEEEKRRKNSLKNGIIYQLAHDDYRLTIQTKKEILLNNIYGVDIDAQAVEVTKLSLLLKLMEDENKESIGVIFKHSDEHVLPNLASNIKCGNSLVGTDVFQKSSMNLFGDDDIHRLNPFSWEDSFNNIFLKGGFDCIIGNPPYRREKDFKYLLDEIKISDFGEKYHIKRMDLWYYFVHLGIEKMKDKALLSFIVNAYWLNGEGSSKLINHLKEQTNIDEIFFLGKLKVFKNVSGQHLVFKITKQRTTEKNSTSIKYITDIECFDINKTGFKKYKKQKWNLYHEDKINIEQEVVIRNIFEGIPSLSKLGIIRQGIAENPASITRKTNEKFGNKFTTGEGVFTLTHNELEKLNLEKNEKRLLVPYHDLCDIDRYYFSNSPSLNLIYATSNTCSDINEFPKLKEHLMKFKKIMQIRRETKNNARAWWQLHWSREEELWKTSKILFKQQSKRPSCIYAEGESYVSFSVNVFLKNIEIQEDYRYIMAVLNSKLLWYWFMQNAKKRGIGLDITGGVLSKAPIKKIDFNDSKEIAQYEKIIELTDFMVIEQKKLRKAIAEHDKNIIEQKTKGLDKQIDEVVYMLYGVVEKEIIEIEKTLVM